jgi:hypothetical protein
MQAQGKGAPLIEISTSKIRSRSRLYYGPVDFPNDNTDSDHIFLLLYLR